MLSKNSKLFDRWKNDRSQKINNIIIIDHCLLRLSYNIGCGNENHWIQQAKYFNLIIICRKMS